MTLSPAAIPFTLRISSGFQVATYPAGATFGPRHCQDFEFVWIIEGDTVYRQNDQTFDAPEGTILLCRPQTTDFFHWDARHRTRHAWFHFTIVGDVESVLGVPDTWRVIRRSESENDLLPTLFRQLIVSGPNREGEPISVVTHLLASSLLAAFITETDGGGGGVENPRYPEVVTRAMAFVAARLDEQPAEPLALGDIARAAFVTPEHLCRLFKSHTGHTPAETVRLLRLDRAAVLLARTNYPVGEIAMLCGFPSQFHFARRFKEAFSRTPSDLRREIAGGSGSVPTTRLLRVSRSHSESAHVAKRK